MSSVTSPMTVKEASQHLWEALSHHSVTMDMSASDPLVRAITRYGQTCREHGEEAVKAASAHVWEELSHHSVTLDLGANDPVIKALAEYGEACRHEGVKA
ncbi:MAG: hypothetical protein ACKVT1_05825 [Dehalococcoidia bacterium]